PSGSGKSSLIDYFVDMNNKLNNGSIFILANSVEFYHESQNCVVRHQEINSDVNTLRDGLANVVDYLPNLVVLDEIADYESLERIWHIIDSGALVFATMRNKSAIEVIQALIALYPSNNHDQARMQLAKSLRVIISSLLIPVENGEVVPAHEILISNSQIGNTIINNNVNDIYQTMTQGKKQGMQTLEQDLYFLLKSGLIKPEDALEYANNPTSVKEMVKYRT
ncbi:MAG: ATPase, T2SS/T4P/T4SS family, partial [Candidatus Cloacimonetes bacterium]|nr:ATPase, T2SS/T4P/T4SS family [Candidatus Cloacimonadota bacterium]